jgi:hypothetical protein
MRPVLFSLIVFFSAAPVAAQVQGVPSCSSQQEIEQVLGSKGKFTPDGCRTLQVTRVTEGANSVCVLDFQQTSDPGVIAKLRDAASQSQWWVSCADLLSSDQNATR